MEWPSRNRRGCYTLIDMTEREFIESTTSENKCWFWLEGSSIGNGICIERVSKYVYEEGWDDDDDPVSGDVMLPDAIDGCPIIEIGEDAFHYGLVIKSLRLPDGIQIVRKYGMGERNFVIHSMPSQLRIAEEGSFLGMTIMSDTFPQSIEEIGDYAFYGCAGLKKLYLCEGLFMLGDEAFSNCPDLIQVSLPATLTLVGNRVFSGCSRLKSAHLHEGMEMLGDEMFRDCRNLECVSLPASLSVVGEGIFSGCIKLCNIGLPEDSKVLSLTENALIRNEDQTLIAWTSIDDSGVLRVPDGIRRIGAYTFLNRTDITSVVFPDSVVEIGQGGFKGCSSLREITFGSGLVCIEADAFKDCTLLTDIRLPDSVVEIGQGGFKGCSSLREIVFGSSLVYIKAEAFKNCTLLTDIRLPDSVVEIGQGGFKGCSSLQNVSVSQEIQHIDTAAFYGCALSDFVIRGDAPRFRSIKELVDGLERCSAEIYAMVTNTKYRFINQDEP